MIHIVFNQSELALMKQVIGLDETLAGEVIQIKDDFAVGPLKDIDTEEGWQARWDWWRMLLQSSPYGESHVGSFDDRQTVKQLKEKLNDNEILKNLTTEWQKATRVLTNTLHRMKIKTGDVFIMWRMKHLINEGRIEVTGDITKSWKEFDVKLPGVQSENAIIEGEA